MDMLKDYDFGSSRGYKTKGLVACYQQSSIIDDILSCLKYSLQNKLPVVACGGGSNILINNRFNGCFVLYDNQEIQKVSETSTYVLVKAGAGLSKELLVKYCYQNGYSGLEFWSGIPGLVGGGVAMNCGAYGSQTQSVVYELELCSCSGLTTVQAHKLNWVYRSAGIENGNVITSATFKLIKSDAQIVEKTSMEYIKDRQTKHPLEYPSCGSVFKNPSGSDKGAWELIKDAGLCGLKIGGATVSTKHSNFIVNIDNAKPQDIIKLIEEIKLRVKEKFNIQLQEEIKIY